MELEDALRKSYRENSLVCTGNGNRPSLMIDDKCEFITIPGHTFPFNFVSLSYVNDKVVRGREHYM